MRILNHSKVFSFKACYHKMETVSMSNTTIVVEKTTRDILRRIGRKNQTFDQLIYQLIKNNRSSSGSNNRKQKKDHVEITNQQKGVLA